MYIGGYGKDGNNYYKAAQEHMKESGRAQKPPFAGYMDRTGGSSGSGRYGKETEKSGREEEADAEEESWEEKMRKWDEEMERIREQNRRERERLQEERIRKRKIQKKLWEKLALKRYLARQDEIMQMNEKISLERAAGEDVYIEKAPLSKSLSVAEIMAICSEI